MPTGEDEVVVRARERIGTVLKGKYRLDRVLGVGGMAAVYGATHQRNANRFAVKILHRELATEASVRERFLREGYAANTVEHPGTVRILDDDTAEDGAVFLVMDLLEGETLEARWERKGHRLKALEVAHLMHQVLDVLAAAHAKRIVHRDIKPENLFLTRERSLKVLDFGVARLLEGSASVTRVGGVLGTPAFMAPEQVLGKTAEVDAQSDVWSVGATAFTLLSGKYVHEAETPEEAMVFTATRPAPSLATVAPDAPAALVRIVDKALMLKKADRWPSARAMQQAIDEAGTAAFAEGDAPDAQAAAPSTAVPVVDAKATAEPAADGQGSVLRLAVSPSDPVEATAPGDGAALRPTSIGGVAASQGGAQTLLLPVTKRLSRPALAGIGAAALVFVGLLVVLLARRGPAPADAAAASSATAAPPQVPATSPAVQTAATVPVVLAEPSSVPIEALPETPHAAAPGAPGARPAPPAPAHAAQPAAHAKSNCTPPYTLDPATGKKKWKAECL